MIGMEVGCPKCNRQFSISGSKGVCPGCGHRAFVTGKRKPGHGAVLFLRIFFICMTLLATTYLFIGLRMWLEAAASPGSSGFLSPAEFGRAFALIGGLGGVAYALTTWATFSRPPWAPVLMLVVSTASVVLFGLLTIAASGDSNTMPSIVFGSITACLIATLAVLIQTETRDVLAGRLEP